ncbi:MAG TPA: PAS domain-containing protein [Bryobacteraceae bacterium]
MPRSNSSEFLSSLLRDAPLAFMRVDASGNVLAWSHEASRLLGWSEKEMLGKPAPDPIRSAFSDLAQGLLNQEQLNHTLNCLKRGGDPSGPPPLYCI